MGGIVGFSDPGCSSLTVHLNQFNTPDFCRCEYKCDDVKPGDGSCPCDKITPGESKIIWFQSHAPQKPPAKRAAHFDLEKGNMPASATVKGAPNNTPLCVWALNNMCDRLKEKLFPTNDDARDAAKAIAALIGCSATDLLHILRLNGEDWMQKVREAVKDYQRAMGATTAPAKGGAKKKMSNYQTVADLGRRLDQNERRTLTIATDIEEGEIPEGITTWQAWELYAKSCKGQRTCEDAMSSFGVLFGVPINLLKARMCGDDGGHGGEPDDNEKGGTPRMIKPNHKGFYTQPIRDVPQVIAIAGGLPESTPLCQWMYSLYVKSQAADPPISGNDVNYFLAVLLDVRGRLGDDFSPHAIAQGVEKGSKLGALEIEVSAGTIAKIREKALERPTKGRRPTHPKPSPPPAPILPTPPPPPPTPLQQPAREEPPAEPEPAPTPVEPVAPESAIVPGGQPVQAITSLDPGRALNHSIVGSLLQNLGDAVKPGDAEAMIHDVGMDLALALYALGRSNPRPEPEVSATADASAPPSEQ